MGMLWVCTFLNDGQEPWFSEKVQTKVCWFEYKGKQWFAMEVELKLVVWGMEGSKKGEEIAGWAWSSFKSHTEGTKLRFGVISEAIQWTPRTSALQETWGQEQFPPGPSWLGCFSPSLLLLYPSHPLYLRFTELWAAEPKKKTLNTPPHFPRGHLTGVHFPGLQELGVPGKENPGGGGNRMSQNLKVLVDLVFFSSLSFDSQSSLTRWGWSFSPQIPLDQILWWSLVCACFSFLLQ